MSSSSHKNDGVPPLYRQGGSLSKVGYFRVAHFKISSDDLFRDFLKAYWHAIPSRVCVKRVRDGSNSEFGSTSTVSLNMRKVYVALGIPSEYREWRWLLSLLRREKNGLPPREEIERIKAEALTRPISVVKPAINEGGKKRPSPPAQETPTEKKTKISSTAREGSPAAPKLMINLTSSKGEKERTAKFVPFVPKRSSRAKSGSPLERLATMKSDKAPLPAKVAPKPTSSAIATNSSAEKKEAAYLGKLEESTKTVSREVAEICTLLKPDLLKDIDICAKFVNDKTTILAAESMFLDQEDTKAAKEMARTMDAEAYSSVKKVKKLEFELAALKGSNTCAPTSLQLENTYQEIVQDLERSISEFRFATYAKDEKLIAAYNQVIHFKKVVDRLESQMLELQNALKINDNLKKEVEELQRIISIGDRLAEFSSKDFETFFISPEDLLAFTFESSIGEVVGEVGAQAGTTEGKAPDNAAAENMKAAEDAVFRKTVGYLSALGSNFRFPGQPSVECTGFLKAVKDRLVRCLGLPIALRIPWHGHVLLDAILLEELRQIFSHKLRAIVGDDGLRDAKSENDAPSYETFYVCLCRGLACGCSSLAGSAGTDL
ncbi:hypothetical protein D8674_008492 [Pyrus ussuriensis x Pyrus communis]|uniref:Uncharacterized protein n=1 Tax=Pyrus ussuriensis x Pyrus communis TaxID=2448454 RepID=A0A5N5HVY1_9ROSA|nr:hypothetical protein D8674_008492 [Pyrus ussuriensis x Pyrus communis]